MLYRRTLFGVAVALAAAFALPAGAGAQESQVKAVASFSILGDMLGRIGGDRVAVSVLVGADADPHVYQPSPADARTLSGADILVMNGLGFEGWMDRLVRASGFEGHTVVATSGVTTRDMDADFADAHDHADAHTHDHAHAHTHAHARDDDHEIDPHAWQCSVNARIYVRNITDGLIAVDPAGEATYRANLDAYVREIAATADEVRGILGAVPEDRRVAVTSHDAFGYFADEFNIRFVAPQGVSTEAEASARDVAALIRQIRDHNIPALFIENITDDRLLQQIARETGARIGGTLFSDNLSGPTGPAPTYLDMLRHNARTLAEALGD